MNNWQEEGFPPESHALKRYREHFPLAEAEDLEAAVQGAEPISPELMQELTWRGGRPSPRDSYFLDREGRGIFVCNQGRVVTYLRLSQAVLDVTRRILEKPVTPPPEPVATPPSPESLTTLRSAAAKRLLHYFNTGALRITRKSEATLRVVLHTIIDGVVEDGDIDRVLFRESDGRALEVRQLSAVELRARWVE